MTPTREIMKSVALPVWPSGLTRIEVEDDVRMEHGLEPHVRIVVGTENWDPEGYGRPAWCASHEFLAKIQAGRHS